MMHSALGNAYADVEGRRALQEAQLDYCRSALGEEHPDTLAAVNGLAMSLYRDGELARALPMLEDVVAKYRRVLGKSHRHTVIAMANLCTAHMALDAPQRAYPLQKKVVKWYRQHFGAQHPDTLVAMAYLANVHFHLGDYEKARQLEEQVLVSTRAELGADHPETVAMEGHLAYTLNNLAVELRESGRFSEAEPIQAQARERMTRAYGSRSLDAAYAYSASGALARLCGERDRAMKFFRLALRIREAELGMDDELTQRVRGRFRAMLH